MRTLCKKVLNSVRDFEGMRHLFNPRGFLTEVLDVAGRFCL